MVTNLHTKAAAERAVKRYRQGNQWIVSWWDAQRNVWQVSHPMGFMQSSRAFHDHIDAVIRGEFEGLAKLVH